jgi:hypothetical protein
LLAQQIQLRLYKSGAAGVVPSRQRRDSAHLTPKVRQRRDSSCGFMQTNDQPKDARSPGYSAEIAETICARLVNGESLRAK